MLGDTLTDLASYCKGSNTTHPICVQYFSNRNIEQQNAALQNVLPTLQAQQKSTTIKTILLVGGALVVGTVLVFALK